MPSSHRPDQLAVAFDDDHAVANAGLVLPALLAQRLDVQQLADALIDLGERPGAAHPGSKLLTLVHSLLAGGDCIDDADLLRSGSTAAVLGHRVLAPSTLGTFLRGFTFGHVRQLDRLAEQVLARVIGAWLVDGDQPSRRRRVITVDGKTLRGARRDGRQVHLLSAMEHASRVVLTQHQVDGAPGEVPGFQPLLEPLELTGAMVTADALQTAREAAEFLVSAKQADYLFTVKANRPALLERCQRLAWPNVPVLDRTRDQAHGRVEIRTLKAVSVRGFGFPHTKQVIQVTRKVRDLGSRRWRTTTAYAVTSLGFPQASPARLADLIRGHWGIETLHHLRDTTFAEDASQVRTGTGPQVMACLRNLVIGALNRAGPVNLAAALRYHSRDSHRPLATLGIRLG